MRGAVEARVAHVHVDEQHAVLVGLLAADQAVHLEDLLARPQVGHLVELGAVVDGVAAQVVERTLEVLDLLIAGHGIGSQLLHLRELLVLLCLDGGLLRVHQGEQGLHLVVAGRFWRVAFH